ncbi:MAG: RNA polymerase subunit sigma-54 [Desulfobacteraceae bacterium 4572_130]|nr:MAG: RNA polymerase subunit sigma-54 [Desulfobacteraceae bacterium 4572_130]
MRTSEKKNICNNIAGSSKEIINVLSKIKKVAVSESSVLITGESGTGKELVAKAIHKNSSRNIGPMVIINCGAIPGELLESELFGHEKGAFTGAHKLRIGRFELADKGTIFLDEIGDMSHDLQVKLLRALQERKFERVGGTRTIKVDIRILSATNKDLVSSIKNGKFREDLFYRLNVIPIHIPPLRKRTCDIPILLNCFQKKLMKRTHDYQKKKFSKKAIELLSIYNWPGNIRELENLMERISVLTETDIVKSPDLPKYIREKSQTDILNKKLQKKVLNLPKYSNNNLLDTDSISISALLKNGLGFNDAVEQYQKSLILYALNQTNWIKARAAELLKMNRTTLVEKIRKMKIEQPL